MQANLLLVVVPLLVTFVMYPVWGRLIDRLGRKPVMITAGLLVSNTATPWIFVTREHWLIPYLAVTIAAAAWPGLELAGLNLLLGMSQSHGGRRLGSACVAVSSLVAAISGLFSGLCAGAFAEALGDH